MTTPRSQDWVRVHTWEGEQAHFRDFPEVTARVKADLDDLLPDAGLRVVYVCGADHAAKCNMGRLRKHGVCVIGRPGTRDCLE